MEPASAKCRVEDCTSDAVEECFCLHHWDAIPPKVRRELSAASNSVKRAQVVDRAIALLVRRKRKLQKEVIPYAKAVQAQAQLKDAIVLCARELLEGAEEVEEAVVKLRQSLEALDEHVMEWGEL